MREPEPGGTLPGDEAAPPASVEEALARALRHGRTAAAESLAAVRALLDAASLVASGRPTDQSRLLQPLVQLLEELGAQLAGGAGAPPGALPGAIAAALDQEIARWEARAVEDPEARAVLRAFLGLRELLWEFGVRPAERDADAPRRGPVKRGGRRRVQRVRVEG